MRAKELLMRHGARQIVTASFVEDGIWNKNRIHVTFSANTTLP